MEQSSKTFICVILISMIICALVGYIIIKSGESYDEELYAEVYEEYNDFQTITKPETFPEEEKKEYITNNSQYNQDLKEENKKIEEIEYETQTKRKGRIIGMITIDKIGINYPILNEDTAANLKVAPVKFWGANPNEVGNLCITAHNYGNAAYFSKLHLLNEGDIVEIMDQKGSNVAYKIYRKMVINENDLTCTSQRTNGKREVTLITCTANSNERLVLKCVEL